MTAALTLAAAAKINLTLHITGRRGDGYHILESLIGFTDITDTLNFIASDDVRLHISGPEGTDLVADEHNLAIKAVRLVQRHLGVTSGVDISLTKNIPVAAGLGGGSADAAATVNGCLTLWGGPESTTISDEILASDLGADVPVCRYGRAALVSGIGEDITPALHWPAAWLVVVNPRVPLATASVFQAFDGSFRAPEDNIFQGRSFDEFAKFLAQHENSLTSAAIALAPIIEDVIAGIKNLPGCRLARMSGSGPTCFGLFESLEEATVSAKTLQDAQPGWWIKPTPLEIKTPG
jgi:4-diphosphocytidyl-2-C-methyl-D-erythritol kinase